MFQRIQISIKMSDEEEYEVETIVGKRIRKGKVGWVTKFLTAWKKNWIRTTSKTRNAIRELSKTSIAIL